MPEGTEGQTEPQGGEGEGQQQQQQNTGGEQQAPPWERDGQEFDPERAWNLIQSLRGERDNLRSEHQAAAVELENLRQASLTDQERAVEEAERRGRTAATTELGQELARVHFDALAGRRNPDFDTAQALEFVDMSRFLGEDGRPNAEAIQAAVERLVPTAGGNQPPSFDGGSRTPATTQDFNQTLRRAAGRA